MPLPPPNPYTFEQSSPLETLVRRASSRKGKGNGASNVPAPLSTSSGHFNPAAYADGDNTVLTPPRRPTGRPPSSPLLHTQFRTSTATAVSDGAYDMSMSYGETSTASVPRSQHATFRDDESVYSRQSEYDPRQSAYDARQSAYDARQSAYNPRSSSLAYAATHGRSDTVDDFAAFYGQASPSHIHDLPPPSPTPSSPAIMPVVVISSPVLEGPPQVLQRAPSQQAGRTPSAVPANTNFSRPRFSRPPSEPAPEAEPAPMPEPAPPPAPAPAPAPHMHTPPPLAPRRPSEDTKRRVLERNAHRSPSMHSLKVSSPPAGSPPTASPQYPVRQQSLSRQHSLSPSPSPGASRLDVSHMPSFSPSPSPHHLRPTPAGRPHPPSRADSQASIYSTASDSFSELSAARGLSPSPSPYPSSSPLPSSTSSLLLVPGGGGGTSRPPLPALLISPAPPTGPSAPGSAMRKLSPTSPLRSPTNPAAEAQLQEGIGHHEANRLAESAACFERAATEGGGCGVGMLMWGLALRHGWGCARDERRAFRWLMKAAESATGDLDKARRGGVRAEDVKSELIMAIYEVGQCFFHGWGIRKDQKMAVSYFTTAAKLGDPDAQHELAFCLANGRGCKKDRKEAARWYRAAVAQGVSDIGLAWIYKEKFK